MDIREIRELTLGKFEANKEIIEKRAEENIEKYRKGTCRICITGKDGQPLKNIKVKINQKVHDFKYGANIFMLDEFESEEDNRKYRDMFHQYFNLATVPYYWGALEPEQGKPRYAKDSPKVYRRPAPDLCFEYCEEKGILPKIHCMVYERPKWLPNEDLKIQLKYYDKRFQETAQRYGGRMYEVEVINELLPLGWGLGDYSGNYTKGDLLAAAFDLAKKYFPNDRLVINDGDYFRISENDFRNKYYTLIADALAKGVPVGKVGFQYHVFIGARKPWEEDIYEKCAMYDPIPMLQGFDVFAELGLPMEITEVTIPTLGEGPEAEEIQAEALRYFYTICFSTPLMETVCYWNTVEGTAYNVENNCMGGLFRKDMSPKPAALMLKKLFTEIWHTDLEIETDENGCAEFRGFYGDYEAEIGGETVKFGIHKAEDNSYQLAI